MTGDRSQGGEGGLRRGSVGGGGVENGDRSVGGGDLDRSVGGGLGLGRWGGGRDWGSVGGGGL